MSTTASRQNLLYVSDGVASVLVYTYPKPRLVGTLTGFISPLGECVDANGNVFIVSAADQSWSSGIIYEYAHGGTYPIATLNDQAVGQGCAIDAKSGDLAVSNASDQNNPYGSYGSVAVYAGAQGNPTMYYSQSAFYFQSFCGYDTEGDLYLSATNGQYANQDELLRLMPNHTDFQQISLNVKLYTQSNFPPSVQWDGNHMAVSSASNPPGGSVSIYRLRIKGTKAVAVGATTLNSKHDHNKSGQLWIQGRTVVGITYDRGTGYASAWRYPVGGSPTHNTKLGHDVYWGVAVSAASGVVKKRPHD